MKIVTTSEMGGRYFICGGAKVNKQSKSVNQSLLQKSPCFEYEYTHLTSKCDMCDIRNYFSLVCLTKIYDFLDHQIQISQNCFYPTTYSKKFLYAIGGKTTSSVVMKAIEKYDVEMDKWIEIKT